MIGDVHGNWSNLRSFLIEQGAINENNERINRDTLKVYCTGDLIDGSINRTGDLLLLEYIRDWFDLVIIGNHELPFMGGPSFIGLRTHDRELQRKLLQLEYEGKYVPAAVVEGFLLVHAGLAERWGFQTEQDACDAVRTAWDTSEPEAKEIPIIDWISKVRGGKWGDETGGVFWLDWDEDRNTKINQIVGHTTFVDGPRQVRYKKNDTEHWNIDVGGKYGYSLGGVILEEGQAPKPVFWGQRVTITYKTSEVKEGAPESLLNFDGFDEDDMTVWEDVPSIDEYYETLSEDEIDELMWKDLMETPTP